MASYETGQLGYYAHNIAELDTSDLSALHTTAWISNLNHLADQYAQVRVNYIAANSGIVLNNISNNIPRRFITLGPFSLLTTSAGTPNPVRVGIAGIRTKGSNPLVYGIRVHPWGFPDYLLPDGTFPQVALTYVSPPPSPWIDATTPHIINTFTTHMVADAETALSPTQTLPLYAASVYVWTNFGLPAGTDAKLEGVYVAEFGGG